MEKKYQVFISSTYEDLKEERKEITQALLEMNCIPTGMEMFQASDDTQWELIKKVIASCDYYIVVVAGRYGSIHPATQKSYTQMEYEYALEIQIPIIGFLYKNPDELPAYRLEKSKKNQKKLEQFKQLVRQKMVRFWSDKSELAAVVTKSMYNIIRTHPRKGWSRNIETAAADNTVNPDLDYGTVTSLLIMNLKELNEKNKELDEKNKELDEKNKLIESIRSCADYRKYVPEYTTGNMYEISVSLILNNFHVDTLQEIASIVLSAGISSMAYILNRIIPAQPVRLELCQNITEVRNVMEHDSSCNLISEFQGILSGKIYLHFYENSIRDFLKSLGKDSREFETADEDMILNSLLQELCSIFTGAVLTYLTHLFFNYPYQLTITDIALNPDIKNYDLFRKNHYIFVLHMQNRDRNSHSSIVDPYILFDEISAERILWYYNLVLN